VAVADVVLGVGEVAGAFDVKVGPIEGGVAVGDGGGDGVGGAEFVEGDEGGGGGFCEEGEDEESGEDAGMHVGVPSVN
jgi:hypothetical protein